MRESVVVPVLLLVAAGTLLIALWFARGLLRDVLRTSGSGQGISVKLKATACRLVGFELHIQRMVAARVDDVEQWRSEPSPAISEVESSQDSVSEGGGVKSWDLVWRLAV